VKFERTDGFKADWHGLSDAERDLFRKVVKDFHAAAERLAEDASFRWPASLRAKKVVNAPRVWEMTWSFSGPDGRATFERIEIDGKPAIRWRRIGTHHIFRQP